MVYKYIVLQIALVDIHAKTMWAIITILLFISFVLGGFEAAITSVNEGTLAEWLEEIDGEKRALVGALSSSGLDLVGFLVRPIGLLAFYLLRTIRIQSFTDFDIATGRSINQQKCVVLMLTLGVIIDVNVTILFGMAIYTSQIFIHLSFIPEFIGNQTFIDGYLPLAGSEGFQSIGVSLILLLFIEAAPKKIALGQPLRFLKITSWIIGIIYIFYVPRRLAEEIDDAVGFLIRKLRLN